MTSLFRKSRININLNIQSYAPIKNLIRFIISQSGHNNTGRIVSFSKSWRVRRNYRFLDFKRMIWDLPAKILRIEYDPNRSSLIALICYYNGILSYILATEKMTVGQIIFTTLNKLLLKHNGNATLLYNCLEGSFLSAVEFRPGMGGILARSAGTQVILLKSLNYLESVIRLPSKEEIVIKKISLVSLGRCSNIDRKFRYYYNAGQTRRIGKRPTSRGVAQNPIDHPHGGGGGRCLVTAWAKIAKNKTTRQKKSSFFIVTSRKFYKKK